MDSGILIDVVGADFLALDGMVTLW